ncbi:MAG: hypothetical protein WEB60_10780 [Terrimicrobiaceae bacterium]
MKFPAGSLLKPVFKAVVFGALILLGFGCQFSRWADVFIDGEVYYLDPDCYSRMTRVQQIFEGQGPFITFHDFENAPVGITPHTTAPMDGLILAGSELLRWGGVVNSRDVSGAWISPFLGLLFLLVIAAWAWMQPFGAAGLLLAAISPILAHAFSVGRPDHQSLLVLLLAGALIAETKIWQGGKAGWGVVSAVVWALACWVSLFEPLIMLGVCLSLRLLVLGRKAFTRGGTWGCAVFLTMLGSFLLLEGWRFSFPEEHVQEFFGRWASQIGELQPAKLSTLAIWLGWLGVALPVPLLWGAWTKRDRGLLASAILMILLLALTFSATRWGYFAALAAVLFLPVGLAIFPKRWLAWMTLFISLWPVARAWDNQLFPEGEAKQARLESRTENILLRETAQAIRALPMHGPVLAPWWISPPLAYWSRRPFIAGSSHQSLPGTVVSAQFYLAATDDQAMALLAERHVSIVVSDDPARLIPNSVSLLATETPLLPMATRLQRRPAPDFLKRVFENQFFGVFEVNPSESPPRKP